MTELQAVSIFVPVVCTGVFVWDLRRYYRGLPTIGTLRSLVLVGLCVASVILAIVEYYRI